MVKFKYRCTSVQKSAQPVGSPGTIIRGEPLPGAQQGSETNLIWSVQFSPERDNLAEDESTVLGLLTLVIPDGGVADSFVPGQLYTFTIE